MIDAALMQLLGRIGRLERDLERLRASVAAPGPWTAFPPSLTQGGPVAATVLLARYQRVGTTTRVEVVLSVTGAGTAGQTVFVNVPTSLAAAGAGHFVAGQFGIQDVSTGTFYFGAPTPSPATAFRGWAPGSTGTLGAAVFTAALAAGDAVYLAAGYEGA